MGPRHLTALRHGRGFTLIELIMVVVILAILIGVGIPSLTAFVASQRVRTAVSDMMADVSFARAQAIQESRQVIMERLPGGATSTWKDGWRVCVDLNSNGACDANEVRKASEPLSGRMQVCSHTANFDARVVFRPDGRIVLAAAPGANDGVTFSDDLADADAANDLIRTIAFGVSGRPLLLRQDGQTNGGTPCPFVG